MGAHEERRWTLYAALAANGAIAITKFIAAQFSGSAGLFAEGLHSIVDTGDTLLLMLGTYLSQRPPTQRHPYGHGQEIYFWTIIVAMSVFGMGGCLSVYRGFRHIVEPEMPHDVVWSYVVLGVSFLFEGTSWVISLRALPRRRGKRPGIWQSIRHGKDSTRIAVILEDSAALIGIVIAAVGITLAVKLDMPVFDAGASIAIGVLLVAVGLVLARETRSLLLGESAATEVVHSIHAIAQAQDGIVKANLPRTMHMGPDHVHVDMDVVVGDNTNVVDVQREIEAKVCGKHPEVRAVSLRFPS